MPPLRLFFTGWFSSLWLDRKSTRLNSSHTAIYTLSLHDALPIFTVKVPLTSTPIEFIMRTKYAPPQIVLHWLVFILVVRSEEHTSELQSHSDLHSFPTRRSSDLYG